ncbi:alpha/beta hydrolase [Bradyrhizobium sp. KB893862 SZCCT0404]|uniref:alpha/beta fold hydrolase n=1 Tax=Bradyrhizobium sp. KB893862 SZCCT0404 TaxID=2807672 RepID=UPI001BA493DB|nr:alpha/beta hydrolase [Bradyrhizobium sp. KB893862 SZCCT0404]MBR1175283.1 alpha/beta hydrolase [Bradyrhizobium sp. KB893862 SZCCT0404]
MEFETTRFEIDGVSTVVKAIGQGPAILALHGGATIEGHEWARDLADRFRVYLPFHPGFGESGTAPHICGMQDMVIHNLRLVDKLRLDRPHLVGHSMGGWMAAETAALAGERFDRLVLNAPAGLNHPEHQGPDISKINPQELPQYLAHRIEIALRYFPGGSLAPPAEEFVAAREKESVAVGNILRGYGLGHPNLMRWLSRIPNETLILWGDKDRMLPPTQAEIWATRIPRARTHIVRDVGHFAMQEDPSCIAAIGDFLAG